MTEPMAARGGSLRRIRWMIRKELWQFRADKLFTLLLIGLPLLQMFAVLRVVEDPGGRGTSLVVVDHDRSPASRELLRTIENTGEAWIRLWADSLEDANRALALGEADALVVIPPGFHSDLQGAGRQASLLIVADGTNSWSGGEALSTLTGAARSFVTALVARAGQVAGLELRREDCFRVERTHNPVAVQIAFLVYQIVLIVSGSALPRERESGTLEQLLVTPLGGLELIIGKAVPAVVVGVADFCTLFFMGRLLWHTPMRGSWGPLLAGTLLFLLAESAWGLLISSRVATQQQAVQIIFIQILFDMSFCGYIVPVDNLPWFLRWVSELLPIRHYLAIVPCVMLRGGGFGVIWKHLAALAGLGAVCWILAVRTLRKTL